MKTLVLRVLATAVLVTRAWSVDLSTNFVDYTVQINGRPARMIFISSLGASLVLEEGANRLGLKGDPFSALTQVKSGGQEFSAPILVFRDPLQNVPWVLRQLVKISHPFLYRQFKGLYDQVTKSLEGVVGWPEVRNNILVFDSDQRVIRRVEQLPPETADWLKWRVVPAGFLALEVPLAGGKKGVLYIDTADNRSIMLAPTPWKEWTQAHPLATMVSRKVWALPLIISTKHEAAADKVELGPLTVTDVAIEDMGGEDAGRLLDEIPADEATVWSLGTGALSRLDLIVDGRNGWAYVHPKSPLTTVPPLLAEKSVKYKKGAAAPPAGNWKVADNVRLEADGFFLREGEYKWGLEDFKGALADFNRALEYNPRNPDAWSDLGAVMEYQGAFTEAVSNYDKAIELRPDYSPWERLYRQTLLWRAMESPPAETKLAATAGETSDPATSLMSVEVVGVRPEGVPGVDYGWPKMLGQFIVGRIDETALLAAAKKSGDADEKKALAYYYIGMTHLSRGDQLGARPWLQKCQDARQKGDDEYYFAVSELKRLPKPPSPKK
jgi:tetratricopeptide (TPR) repeat protein